MVPLDGASHSIVGAAFATEAARQGFDVVLLLSVLHNQDDAQTRTLVEKAFRALQPPPRLLPADLQRLRSEAAAA